MQDGGLQTGSTISQTLDMIGTKFKRLYLCFIGPAIQCDNRDFCKT